MNALDQLVRVAVYESFVDTANAPTVDQLSFLLGRTPSEIEASFRRLGDSHVLVLDGDQLQIRMAMPFSAVPTSFRVTTAVGSWFANCAWDALGIPAALGVDARINTTCGDCGEPVQLSVVTRYLTDESGMIHFAVPAAHWWDDIGFT